MARLFGTGFETGDLDDWEVHTNVTVISTSGYDLTGSYCARLGNYSGYLKKHLSTSYAALYTACKFTVSSLSTPHIFIGFYDSANTLCAYIKGNSTTGVLEAVVGASVVVNGDFVLLMNHTYLLEVYYKPLNTGGEITVKLDGVVELTFSGDTTNGLENVQWVYFGGGDGDNTRMDDIVIDDAAWIGNTYFQVITPTANGTTVQWTPSTGNNYQCVDEIPPSDTDYNYTNTADNIDTFTMSDMTGDIKTVKAVYLQVRAGYEGNPTPTQINGVLYINSTNYLSTAQNVPLDFAPLTFIWEINPDTSAAFTESDINGLEAGYKAIKP